MQISFHKIQRCSECGEQGQFVKNITVKHIVKKDISKDLNDEDFHLCRNPSCIVGYYNTDTNVIVNKDDFKRPIWLKEGSNPVIACYCGNIKDDDIIKAVVETDLTELQPIMIYLHGSIGDKCQVTNPTGHCCTAFFKETIAKGLTIKETLKEYGDLKVDSKEVPKEVYDKLKELEKAKDAKLKTI